MKLVSICKNCFTKCLNISVTRSIEFLGPKNGSFAVKIKALCYLETEILTKTCSHGSHFVKSKMAAI